jgi:hypothetical protein
MRTRYMYQQNATISTGSGPTATGSQAGGTIAAITACPRTGRAVHTLSLGIYIVAVSIFLYEMSSLLADAPSIIADCYILIVIMVIPLYWIGAIYRFMLTMFSAIYSLNIRILYSVLSNEKLLPVSIIVETRNEPSDIVI